VWHNNKSGLVRIVLIGELPGNHTCMANQVQKDIAEVAKFTEGVVVHVLCMMVQVSMV
jgi:hypothetical protein